MESVKIRVKKYRSEAHFIVKRARTLNRTRETSLAITNAEEAMMWFGNSLKYVSNDNPYKESMNSSSDKIEPFFEPNEWSLATIWQKGTQVRKVKRLREHIAELYDHARKDFFTRLYYRIRFIRTYENALDSLTKAKNWLGMELGRIRDESKNEPDDTSVGKKKDN